MGGFARYLTLWVGLAMAAGAAAGSLAPGLFAALARAEIAHVNLPVAVLIWVMIWPMMVQVDFAAVRDVGRRPAGLILTVAVNWLVKPFTMAALGWLFFRVLFADLVDPQTAGEYVAGMVLLGVAPCTAMVFVWSELARGDPAYTLVQVAVNDLIMVFAFAPIAAFLLGMVEVRVPWQTLLLAVVLYVVLPLAAGVATRRHLARPGGRPGGRQGGGPAAVAAFLARVRPWSAAGLVATVFLLFGFQGRTILADPLPLVLIAVPLVIQSFGIFALALAGAAALRLPYRVAAPACLIGTSNFFELAVAVAISLFGIGSGAALATVVGVLVEVPVMLALVALALRLRPRFPSGDAEMAPDRPA